MANSLSFSIDLAKNQISPNAAGRQLTTLGSDGVRIVSGLDPHLALGYSAAQVASLGLDPRIDYGYSDFDWDAYTTGIIYGIENRSPRTMTTVQYKLHLVAGEKLTFDYDFIPGDAYNNDYAFALLADAAGNVTPLLLADVGIWQTNSGATHFTGFSYNIGATGDYKLLLAAADGGDTKGPSALIMHSIAIEVPLGDFRVLPSGLQLTGDNSLLKPALLTPGSAGALGLLQSSVAAGLISQDGGGLISQDGGGFKLPNGATLISQDGGGLVASGGGNLVASGGGNLVASGGGNLTLSAADTARLVNNAASFNSLQPAQLVASGGGNVISRDGAGLVASGGGNIISQDGGGLISQDGGGLTGRQLQNVELPPDPPPPDAVPAIGSEIYVSPAANLALAQDDPSVAALTNGRFVVAWTKTALNGKVDVRAQVFNADRTKFGAEIVVATTDDTALFQPSVAAMADGAFGIAFSSLVPATGGGTEPAMQFTSYDAAGARRGSSRIFNGIANQPALASMADGGVQLVFRRDGTDPGTSDLRIRRFDANGAGVGSTTTLVSAFGASDPSDPAIAGLLNGGYAVAYADRNAFGTVDADGIFIHVVSPGVNNTFQVNTATAGVQHFATIATLANGNLVVAWVDEGTVTPTNPVAAIRAQILTPAGNRIGGQIAVAENTRAQSQAPGLVALADGRFVVTWEQASVTDGQVAATSVRAAAFKADGSLSTASFPVGVGGSNLSAPAVTQLADGTLAVAAVHAQESSSDVRLAPLTFATAAPPSAALAATEFRVSAAAVAGLDSRAGVIASLSSGKSVVAWQANPGSNSGSEFNINAQLLNADGTAAGAVVNVVAAVAGNAKTQPTVTGLAGGGFVVGWTDRHNELTVNGDPTRATDILAQRFDAAGAKLGAAFTVNTVVVRNQTEPAFASLSSGGFVALWTTSTSSTSNTSLLAQRFAADGAMVGGTVAVAVASGVTTSSAGAAAGLRDGGFTVVYTGKGSTAGVTGLYAQVFSATGVGGTPVLVQANAQPQFGAVATLLDGNFVVTWSDGAANGSSVTGILGTVQAQIYTAAGVAVGSRITVGVAADVATDPPAITALADGRFLIAYDAYTVAGNVENIRARIFNADGTASGAEFAASDVTSGIRASRPSVTQLGNGDIQVVSTHGNGGSAENSTFLATDFFSSTVHVKPFTLATPGAPAMLRRLQLVDGYIVGATVFADANNDGLLTPGEQTAVTGANGAFFFTTAATGPIIALGGTDVSTNLPFTGTLSAPAGSTSVTALSTLVQKLMVTNGGNQAAANGAVAAAFGLPLDSQLGTVQPVQATLDRSATGTAIYLANASLFGTVALASAAGATGDLFGKLAAQIAAAPAQPFNPTTTAAMQALGLSGAVAADTAAIAAANQALTAAKLAAHPSDPAALIADVTAVEVTVQGNAATALRAAVASGTTGSVATTYTGSNLSAIATAQADTTAGNAPKFSYTNAVTSAVGYEQGALYTGPVDYLRQQYIWAGTDSVAIAAATPNAFVKGGPGGDALLAKGGQNVLDGAGGSNFLIGADGSDGGKDVFFVDSRESLETWSTIVNFHVGDLATIFGFRAGVSTRPYTDVDGAVGYTGVTIHSEIDGPGTGIKGSMTFAGIDRATAEAHFEITTGTLPGDIGYMLIEYK